MLRFIMTLSAIWAGLAVAMGAFGAHALKDVLPQIHEASQVSRMEANWETAARYQLIHALAAFTSAGLLVQPVWRLAAPASQSTEPASAGAPSGWSLAPAVCFLAGTLIFSGCLYAMVLGAPRLLGAIVPIGGGLMILGWLGVAVTVWRNIPSR